MYRIIWPECRAVSADQLLTWAADDVANGLHEGPAPATLADALAVLAETGSVTLARFERPCGP
jgi:hypothetical protein